MNTQLLLRISFQCIKKHKGRSFLTILGIIVGIAAIIATIAIGAGAEEKLRKQILSMGKNFIFIHAGRAAFEGKTADSRRKPVKKLTEKDAEIISDQCPDIKKISANVFPRDIVSYQSNNVLANINSGNENYLKIVGRKIKLGTFFNKQHVLRSAKVIILGSKTAEELFHSLNPVGKPVMIKNTMFTVIGVTDNVKNYLGISDPNLTCYMPITTAKKQLMRDGTPYIHGISVMAQKKEQMRSIVKKIKKILRFKHRLDFDEPDDFTVIDQQAMANAAKASTDILNLLLLIIASISLLVGGIGVMNIMLVSVSERTKEIGIRMALGATSGMILKQFIIEAIALCFIGGIFGIIIGILIPFIASFFTGWIVVIKLSSIIIAFLVTSIVGLIFGFYPAHKASKLNPVEALRET